MGWKTEGEFKQETYRDGRYIDVVRFAIFKKGA
jgi:RimJ/RimL family protein N-acetyltransferase